MHSPQFPSLPDNSHPYSYDYWQCVNIEHDEFKQDAIPLRLLGMNTGLISGVVSTLSSVWIALWSCVSLPQPHIYGVMWGPKPISVDDLHLPPSKSKVL
jgi:hypothetical protein